MSASNDVTIIYVPETAYGTTPALGTWETARFTSEGITATPLVNQSEEVRNDRMRGDQFKTSVDVTGNIDFELSATTYDTLFELAMNATWATNVLKIGKENKSISIEKNYSDLTANHFIVFDGVRCSEMSLGFTHGEAVTGSFNFAGSDVTSASATASSGGTVNPATSNRVMNAVSDMTSLKIDGTAFSGCLSSVDFTINNNLRPAKCIGQDYPQDQFLGTADVTGSIEAYLSDTTVQWYTDKVINQTAMEIEFTLSDGTNTYTFHFPNCRISGDTPSAEGLDTDVMISAEFTALYDATEASSLVITRT